MKKIGRLLVMLIIIAMAITALSCGNRGASGSASTAVDGYWSGEITYSTYMNAPWDPRRDIVVKKVEQILSERYGINVTLTSHYVEWLNLREILNTRIAGGTAPDVWLGAGDINIQEYYNQGVAAEWDVSFFRQWAPNLSAYIDKGGRLGEADPARWWGGATMATGTTTKMVTLPSAPIGKFVTPNGVVYRGDWLQNLGVAPNQIPHDMNEWIALMRRFVNEDPNRSGRRDTYAFSSSMMRVIFTAHGIYTGYLASATTPSNTWWYYVDGKMQNGDTLPGSRDALAVLAQLYAEGLIDPNFVNTERNPSGYWAVSLPFINGQIGVSAHASFDHYRMKEVMGDDGGPVSIEYWAVNGENPGFVYGPWVVGPKGEYGWYVDNDYGLGESLIWNKNLESNPNKLATMFKIMDIFATDEELAMLVKFGIEGLTYNYNSAGYPVLNIQSAEQHAMGIDTLRAITGNSDPFHPIYDELWYRNPSRQRIIELQSQPYWGSYNMPAIAGWPPSTSLYQADLLGYREETFTKIIRGELGIDYWDTYVAEYMRRGGAVLEQEAMEIYRRQNP